MIHLLAMVSLAAPPTDSPIRYDTVLTQVESQRIEGVGAMQGVTRFGERLYFYGDDFSATPRVGRIVETGFDCVPTGRTIELSRDGKPLSTHPTGLTDLIDDDGVVAVAVVGDTLLGVARWHTFDWRQALADGNLDRSMRPTPGITERISGEVPPVGRSLVDHLSVNGCRPCRVDLAYPAFVRDRKAGLTTYFATADYGDQSPFVRLHSADPLQRGYGVLAGKTVHLPCGDFTQNLHFDTGRGELICVQNVTAGVGWRLEAIPLTALLYRQEHHGPLTEPVYRWRMTFPAHSELEGLAILPDGRFVLAVAAAGDNVYVGIPERVRPGVSPAGWLEPVAHQPPVAQQTRQSRGREHAGRPGRR